MTSPYNFRFRKETLLRKYSKVSSSTWLRFRIKFSEMTFQAVVLAGVGQDILSLEETFPKALLYVANHPMIFFVLRWLESADVKDIFILTNSESCEKIRNYLTKVYSASTSASNVEVIECDSQTGGVEAILSIKDKITGAFITVPCDLLVSYPLGPLLDSFRINQPCMMVALTDDTFSKNNEPMFFGLDSSNMQIVWATEFESKIHFGRSLLESFPTMNIYSVLRDMHIYVFQRWVLDLLLLFHSSGRKEIQNIKPDLVPFLVKCALPGFLERQELISFAESCLTSNNYLESSIFYEEQRGTHKEFAVPLKHSISCSSLGEPDSNCYLTKYDMKDLMSIFKCFAFKYFKEDKLSESFCFRADSAENYLSVNLHMAKIFKTELGAYLPPLNSSYIVSDAGTTPKTKTHISNDVIIGNDSKIGPSVIIKKSVIGMHCVIGKGARIIGSVIMDHAVIEEK